MDTINTLTPDECRNAISEVDEVASLLVERRPSLERLLTKTDLSVYDELVDRFDDVKHRLGFGFIPFKPSEPDDVISVEWCGYRNLIIPAIEGLGWKSYNSRPGEASVCFDREKDDDKLYVCIDHRDPKDYPAIPDEDDEDGLISAVREALRPVLGDPIDVVNPAAEMVLRYDALQVCIVYYPDSVESD